MIVIVSDQHIGDRNFKYEEFLKFIMSLEKDTTIILNGDFEDLYKIDHVSAKSEFSLLYSMLERFNIIRLKGNHDDILSLLREYRFFTSNGKKVVITHGDQFDHLTRISWYTKVASKVESFIDTVFRCNFRKVLNSISLGLLSRLGNYVNYKALNNYWDCDIVIVGHTHFAKVLRRGSRVVINSGEWLRDCNYIKVDEDGSISLNWWKKGTKVVI